LLLVFYLTNGNKAIVDSRLRPRCATHDEYLLIFIVEQNLAGLSTAMLGVIIENM